MECNGNLPDKGVPSSSSVEDLSDYTDADESISAPTEILAEFLSAVMLKDYDSALKYCKMILQYEPNHATAKEFYPLILEKIIQDNENNQEKYLQRKTSAQAESKQDEAGESSSDAESSDDNSESEPSEESESVDGEDEDEDEAEEEEEKRTSDSDATTASYSSLEDEEAEADNAPAPAHAHAPTDDNAYVVSSSGANNNYSDSESPTEPVSQALLASRLRAQVVPARI